MKNLWSHHLKYYDLFQNNLDEYKGIIRLHLEKLEGLNKILDTGAGSGNLTLELLKEGHEVTAIDNHSVSLKVLLEKCKKFNNKLRTFEMDVQNLDFKDNEFDGASSMFVIPFVKDNSKYFKEIYRVLKKGSRFTISAWSSEPTKELTDVIIQELTKKDILPKFKKEWDYISQSVTETSKFVKKSQGEEELKDSLKKIGFKKVQSVKNSYGKFVHFLVCKK
ncbi:MAG: methyltransferase domain-containing protein [Nanoarchaeota archaeon]